MKSFAVWIRSIPISFLLFAATVVSAQNSQVLYFMDLPQNHLVNPALRPSCRIYAGLPAITGISLNISNSVFNFSDIFARGQKVSESTIPIINSGYDLGRFMTRIGKFNYFDAGTSLQLIGAGFTVKDDIYISFDIIDHFMTRLVVPGDIFELALRGNDKFFGTTVNLSNLDAGLKYYREIGGGFSMNLSDRLRFGARAKLLIGVAAMELDNHLLNINVVDDNSHTFNTNMALNISAPVKFYPVTDGSSGIDRVEFEDDRFGSWRDYAGYLTSFRNIGFGLDAGAEFRVTDRIFASMAVTDLGYIKWKSDLTRLETEKQIEFSGLNMEEVYNGSASFGEMGEAMIDSVRSSLRIIDSPDPFFTMLPAGLTLAGKYVLNDYLSFGLLSYSRLADKRVRESFTLSGNLNFGGFFSASLAYTASNRSYDNLGLGLAIRGLYAQFYFLVDRIPLNWSSADFGDSSFPFPHRWNMLNVRTGFNLVFGNNRAGNKSKNKF
ncbi:MAG TPA: DUF5723 family protein [Bacteroidales bacterium]|jgi:hypothetical protein|nr:DUF5723 family protein [Bacteroidales bacterium]